MINVLVFAGFFAFVGIFIAVAISAEKKRAARLLEAMRGANVQLLHSPQQPDKAVAQSVFGRVGLMRGLPNGPLGVRYAGGTSLNGRELVILEHSYTSGSGKSESTVRHSMAAIECPATWPELTLTPEGPLRKLAEMVGHKDIQLEDASFNARWRIKGSDEEFATVLLSRPMQERLATWPKEYWIRIGLGAIVIVARGHLTAPRLTEMIRLVGEFVQMIPAEMEMWGADAGGSFASRSRQARLRSAFRVHCSAMTPVVPVVLTLGAIAAIAVPIFIAERRRRQQLLEALQKTDIQLLSHRNHKDSAAAAHAFGRMGTLQNLRRGVKGVSLAGRKDVDGREVNVVEHSYVVSTGKSAHTVYHSMAAVEAPPAWPELRLTAENIFHKLADMVGLKDIRVESEAFNARWRVKGRDQEFATVFLTPEIQQRLTDWPRGYSLAIGRGAIVAVANNRLTPERLTTLLRLVTEVASLVPAEMEMWNAEDPSAQA